MQYIMLISKGWWNFLSLRLVNNFIPFIVKADTGFLCIGWHIYRFKLEPPGISDLAILMLFYSVTQFSVLSPLKARIRCTLKQRWDLLKIYFQDKDKRSVVNCLNFIKKFGCREKPSVPDIRKLIAKVCKISFIVVGPKGERTLTVRTPENIKTVLESVCCTFHSPVCGEFCEKYNWFKSWSRITICFVFASLNGPTRNCTMMSI